MTENFGRKTDNEILLLLFDPLLLVGAYATKMVFQDMNVKFTSNFYFLLQFLSIACYFS